MGAFDGFGSAFSSALSSGLGGGLASQALGAIGGVFSGINARKNMRRQQRYNLELLQKQNDYATEQADAAYEREKDFYNIQNDYNDPSAVRQRYEAAGINVNSAFGTAGSYTPNQSSPSVPKADTISPPYQNADVTFGDPLEAAYKMAMIRNINAQTDKTESETPNHDEVLRGQQLANDLLEQKIIGQDTANKIAEIDREFARFFKETDLAKQKQAVANMEAQYREIEAKIQLAADEHERNPVVLDNLKKEGFRIAAQTGLAKAQISLAESNVRLNSAVMQKIASEIENINADTTIKSFEAKIKKIAVSEAYNNAKVSQINAELAELSKRYEDTAFNRNFMGYVGNSIEKLGRIFGASYSIH